jgi:hypothetical protein
MNSPKSAAGRAAKIRIQNTKMRSDAKNTIQHEIRTIVHESAWSGINQLHDFRLRCMFFVSFAQKDARFIRDADPVGPVVIEGMKIRP